MIFNMTVAMSRLNNMYSSYKLSISIRLGGCVVDGWMKSWKKEERDIYL